MSNPNVYDDVLERVLGRVDKVSERLTTKFKNVKPFAQEQIPKEEMLRAYESLSYDDMNSMVIHHGVDKVNEFIFEMEQAKLKRQRPFMVRESKP